MRRLWKTVLVCACAALALVGAAAPRATDQTWEWGSGQNFVRVVRESATGPVASIEISAEARCDSGPGGPGVYTSNVGTVIAGPLAVAGDGSFSYHGPVPDVDAQSHLSVNGRFADGRLTGSFRYDAVLPGAHCVTGEIAFTGDCVDCPQPPPPPDVRFAPTARDLTLVPFRQIGRAPLGTTAGAFRARYPKQEYQGANHVRGETLMFFGFSADGEPVGPRLLVYVNRHGQVWRVGAHTENVGDRTTWVRTSGGVGIGSTRAEVRRAFPKLQCGTGLFTNGRCGVISGKKPNLRTTEFGFDGGRVTAVSVAAWGLYYG